MPHPEQAENHAQGEGGDSEAACVGNGLLIDSGVEPATSLTDGDRLQFTAPKGFHVNQAPLNCHHLLRMWIDRLAHSKNRFGEVIVMFNGDKQLLVDFKGNTKV